MSFSIIAPLAVKFIALCGMPKHLTDVKSGTDLGVKLKGRTYNALRKWTHGPLKQLSYAA